MDSLNDVEQGELPTRLLLSRAEYARKASVLARYYEPVKQDNMIELRLSYPPPGLSDDPAHMQLMAEMHFDSLMRYGLQPVLD